MIFYVFSVWIKILVITSSRIDIISKLLLFFEFDPTRMREATVAVTVFTQI